MERSKIVSCSAAITLILVACRSGAPPEESAGNGFTMLRLPYGDDERFGIQALMPDADVALDDLLGRLDADTWQQPTAELASSTPPQRALPRFELECDATLDDMLQNLRMASAFGDGNFTPMSLDNPWLGTVVQKTYIRVR